MALGLAALLRADLTAATLHLTEAFDIGARHPRLLRSLGDLARRRADQPTATAYYRLALEENPDQPSLRRLLEPN